MFLRKEKTQSGCPDNRFLSSQTCNLLENVQFPCTALPDSLCNEQLKCETGQGDGNYKILRQTFAEL